MIDRNDLERIANEVESKLMGGSCADWARSHDLADEVAQAVISSAAKVIADALDLDQGDEEKAHDLLQTLIGMFALAFELGTQATGTRPEDMPDLDNVLDFNPEDQGGLH